MTTFSASSCYRLKHPSSAKSCRTPALLRSNLADRADKRAEGYAHENEGRLVSSHQLQDASDEHDDAPARCNAADVFGMASAVFMPFLRTCFYTRNDPKSVITYLRCTSLQAARKKGETLTFTHAEASGASRLLATSTSSQRRLLRTTGKLVSQAGSPCPLSPVN